MVSHVAAMLQLDTALKHSCQAVKHLTSTLHHMHACITQGDPTVTIPQLVRDTGAGLLITDFSPLRIGKTWRKEVRGMGANEREEGW